MLALGLGLVSGSGSGVWVWSGVWISGSGGSSLAVWSRQSGLGSSTMQATERAVAVRC